MPSSPRTWALLLSGAIGLEHHQNNGDPGRQNNNCEGESSARPKTTSSIRAFLKTGGRFTLDAQIASDFKSNAIVHCSVGCDFYPTYQQTKIQRPFGVAMLLAVCALKFLIASIFSVIRNLDISKPLRGPPDPRSPKTPQQQKKKFPKP